MTFSKNVFIDKYIEIVYIVSFSCMFSLCCSDVEGLKAQLHGCADRKEAHEARLREEEKALQEESHRYGDIVFVNVVDTYRTVPYKLLYFYKW